MAISTRYDAPIYKVLANNDTGVAKGHQGGFVLPKDLEDYLPLLRNQTSFERPTVDVEITADLFDGLKYLGTVETRYQYQTWGGERSPERRITRNLSNLLNRAKGDDILVIERGIDVENHYRFTLIREQNANYGRLFGSFAGSRWGILNPRFAPAKETEVINALKAIEKTSSGQFSLFEEDAAITETRAQKVARSRAFKRMICAAYEQACAFCRGGLQHPDGRNELDAGHIVSRSLKGSDDVRNGLLLCKSHHWAFDNGLVGVTDKFSLVVPKSVQKIERNESLAKLHNREIRLPMRDEAQPSLKALTWHRENILLS